MANKTKLETADGAPSAGGQPTVREETSGYIRTQAVNKTVKEGFNPATRLESAETQSDRETSGWLPPVLQENYRITHEFDALGTEADAFLVENQEGATFFAKIYRKGIKPNAELLEGIQKGDKDHLVEIFEYGESGGRWFELLEYIEGGSLRDLINSEGPAFSQENLLEIVREIASALEFIHGEKLNIEHRDLKPENILVRTRNPLDLVLTDFGIASVLSETIHYTTANRTLAYAPPEAVSGSVFRTAWDHWSLGMIVVELLIGYHPFQSLSDQVIQSNLATQPVDEFVEGVDDGAWRKLCRGLLRREPKKRWGTKEIRLWLENSDDPRLVVEEEVSQGKIVVPYPFNGTEYTTTTALGRALANDWEAARREWQSGRVLRWVKEHLGDFELERKLEEIDLLPDADLDEQVFRLLHVLAPSVPLSFKGMELTTENITSLANKSIDSGRSRDTLLALYDSKILKAAAIKTGYGDVEKIHQLWGMECADYQAARGAAQINSKGEVPDILDKSRGRDEEKRAMLLAATVPENAVITALRKKAQEASTPEARECSWFVRLGNPESARPHILILIIALASRAEQEGAEERAVRQRKEEKEREVRQREEREEREKRNTLLIGIGLAVGLIPIYVSLALLSLVVVGIPILVIQFFGSLIWGWTNDVGDRIIIGYLVLVVLVLGPGITFWAFIEKIKEVGFEATCDIGNYNIFMVIWLMVLWVAGFVFMYFYGSFLVGR